MQQQESLHIGDHVRYNDINLMNYHGILRTLGRTPRGGDCTVEWYNPNQVTGEACLSDLCKLER